MSNTTPLTPSVGSAMPSVCTRQTETGKRHPSEGKVDQYARNLLTSSSSSGSSTPLGGPDLEYSPSIFDSPPNSFLDPRSSQTTKCIASTNACLNQMREVVQLKKFSTNGPFLSPQERETENNNLTNDQINLLSLTETLLKNNINITDEINNNPKTFRKKDLHTGNLTVTYLGEVLKNNLARIGDRKQSLTKEEKNLLSKIDVETECLIDLGSKFVETARKFRNSVEKEPEEDGDIITSLLRGPLLETPEKLPPDPSQTSMVSGK